MTFQEYINNPMGTKSAVMSNRKIYEDLYHDKWKKIMVRENGHVEYRLYKRKNSYICHLKIPSEVIDKFYYDVVIKLTPDSPDKNLKNAKVRFFSNDPSFNYTFAHAFYKNDLHIQELIPKMSKEAILKKAVEKNPKDDIGYVKSLYFAYIVMTEKGLFNILRYDAEAKPYVDSLFLATIKHTDDCIRERQEAGEALIKKNRKEKEKEKQAQQRTPVIHPEVRNTMVRTVKTTQSIGSIKSTKKSSKVKTAKRV